MSMPKFIVAKSQQKSLQKDQRIVISQLLTLMML